MSTTVRRNEKKIVESPGQWLMLQFEHRAADEKFIPGTAVRRWMAEIIPDHAGECWMCNPGDGENLEEAWIMNWQETRRSLPGTPPAVPA